MKRKRIKDVTGTTKMKGKLGDSRGEEDLLRRRRDIIRGILKMPLTTKAGTTGLSRS